MQFYAEIILIFINIKLLAIYCEISILAMHFLYEKNKDHQEHKKIAQKKKSFIRQAVYRRIYWKKDRESLSELTHMYGSNVYFQTTSFVLTLKQLSK